MCVSLWCFTATPSVSAAAAEAGVPVTSGPPASVVASVSPAVALEVAEASSHAPSSSSGHSSPLVQPIIVNPMEEGESGAVWLAGGSCPLWFRQCQLFRRETPPCEVVCAHVLGPCDHFFFGQLCWDYGVHPVAWMWMSSFPLDLGNHVLCLQCFVSVF